MEFKDNKIMKEVSAYCKLNNIEDIDGFMLKCFDVGFNIEKYGLLGKPLNDGEKDLKTGIIDEKQVIKEVIVEKRVEIPVEVIKEVEKIVEVPVEIIKEVVVEKEVIREVPVEKVVTKIEYISDKTSENELIGKIEQLEENIFHLNEQIETERKIFSTKTEEMENNFHYEMSNKHKELDELRRNLDVKLDDSKVKMLQTTIQNLTSEVRELKKKNEELEQKLLDTPKQLGDIPAKFHGSSNLNNNLYK
jgi:predicted RNase H-like nuclease (RuvC/YqgF family)